MFEPTIKYRRVNDPSPSQKDITESLKKLDIVEVKEDAPVVNEVTKSTEEQEKKEPTTTEKKETSDDIKKESEVLVTSEPVKAEPDYTFEEEDEDDCTIEVDPEDKERIIVTLSTGKQFSTDRYCPHAGADLSYHGKVSEHDYPPEIGPVLMCPIHYWEFALEKGGKGGGGWATINACPVEVAEKCAASSEKKELDW
jgi:nitrite reductase/ring-hydroxylating ferredoxin subunit